MGQFTTAVKSRGADAFQNPKALLAEASESSIAASFFINGAGNGVMVPLDCDHQAREPRCLHKKYVFSTERTSRTIALHVMDCLIDIGWSALESTKLLDAAKRVSYAMTSEPDARRIELL